MIEELLRRFARENFDDTNYVPLLHGHTETAKAFFLRTGQKFRSSLLNLNSFNKPI